MKMNSSERDLIYSLAQDFAVNEIKNLETVSAKMNIPLSLLIENNFISGEYEITESVGKVSKNFFKKNLPEDVYGQLNNNHFFSFEKIVNSIVREWVKNKTDLVRVA